MNATPVTNKLCFLPLFMIDQGHIDALLHELTDLIALFPPFLS